MYRKHYFTMSFCGKKLFIGYLQVLELIYD